MRIVDLSGEWTCEIPGFRGPMRVPGTLDESGIGPADDPARQWQAEQVRAIGFWRPGDPIVTRLTRRHSFEGEARISRTLRFTPPRGARVFAEVERARFLRLQINGREAPLARPASLSAPQVFDITGLLTGADEIAFLSDNSYPRWPRAELVYASAASDETQTNWNGLTGFVRLRVEKPSFIEDARVYPRGNRVDVWLSLTLSEKWKGDIVLRSDALGTLRFRRVLGPGAHELCFAGLPVRPGAARWELDTGGMTALRVEMRGLDPLETAFGLRDFRARHGALTLNGRRVFLRGETNCAVFPETGYLPTDKARWLEILRAYRAYGVNFVRFHSHCPPEAAFAAADELGMLMQPELSDWNPKNAFSTREARNYYKSELKAILRTLANHPSFVMLTLGNELQYEECDAWYAEALLHAARAVDPTRLFAAGSNAFYGERGPLAGDDFYTAMACGKWPMRATCDGPSGPLNGAYPDFRRDYAGAAAAARAAGQPVFSFEVGQYASLPDFGQIADYRGVTEAKNLAHIQSRVLAAGFGDEWRQRAAASGELALLCYRAEAEAALRTAGYSGIVLLGLQDFPGQGTALIGMLDAHMRPKPFAFAQPGRFRAFFRDTLPLALLPRMTYTAGETLRAEIKLAHYGKTALTDGLRWSLRGGGFAASGTLAPVAAPAGALTGLGEISAPLAGLTRAQKLTLTLAFAGETNAYSVWVYPDRTPERPQTVYECRALDARALETLRAGGRVLLAPDELPGGVRPQFSTDFWSVCTFPSQSGCMGQWIDEKHPVFRRFPTDSHTDWQWWPMAGQPAMVLPAPFPAIVAEMDSFAYLRPMAQLFECRCGGGRLLVSSLRLHRLTQYPEARALLAAVYDYMASDDFRPERELTPEWVKKCVE